MLTVLVAACADDAPTAADPTPTPEATDPTPAPEQPDEGDDEPAEATGSAPVGEFGTFSNVLNEVPVVALDVTPTRDNTLIVSYAVSFTGDAIHDRSNAAYDWTIRDLLQGDIGTVNADSAGNFSINRRVVDQYWVEDDAAGNRTYTFQLADDLTWSDGSQISAFDFVATLLMRSSPQWIFESNNAQAGQITDQLLGRAAYAAPFTIVDPTWEAPEPAEDDEEAEPVEPPMIDNPDRVDYFAGVRMIDDLTFSMTIDGENLPYFFEYAMVAIAPWPAHVMVPGIDIITDENGSRFASDFLGAAQTFADGYRFNPTVVAGPYTFVSFEDEVVTLARNPMFSGDIMGRQPTIDFVQQIVASDQVNVDMLFAGEIDIIPDNLEAALIERVQGEPGFNLHQYIRFGYGVLNFQLYAPHLPVSDVNVRLAMAHVVDRQAVLDAFLGGFGSLIDTHASPGQWMWQARGAEALSRMRQFSINFDVANDYLDQTEWVFEADGTTPFDRTQANVDGTYLRHNADGEPLHIRNAAANEALGAVIEVQTVQNAAMAGIRFTSEFADWSAVIMPNMAWPWNLPEEELIFSTMSMGTGFTAVFDPYFTFHSDMYEITLQGGVRDAQLDDAIERMRNTDPTDIEGFLDGWLDFVVRFNEVLPTFPLYNNIWIDFYNEDRVSGMEAITDLASWAVSIISLSLNN